MSRVTPKVSGRGPGNAGATRSGDQPFFPCLDGLRAMGVFAVFLQHVGFTTGATVHHRWGHFMAHLEIGPALFFVLSAFLLSGRSSSRTSRAGRPRRRECSGSAGPCG